MDLDGVLAEYHGWKGHTNIGPPIPKMVERVQKWLRAGKNVKIFTARIRFEYIEHEGIFEESDYNGATVLAIQKWCLQHLGCVLPITCIKDYGMIELWDDRCVQVIPNTGEVVKRCEHFEESDSVFGQLV